MSEGVQIAAISATVTLILAFGGGGRWAFNKAVELWDKAMDKKDAEIKDLREVREDTLAQGVGEAKAEAIAARQVAERNHELLSQLLTEWRGR